MVKRCSMFLTFVAGISLPLLICGCEQNDDQNAAAGAKANTGEKISLRDKPLADYQGELLTIAFETASSIPLYPHIRDRCRAQEEVVVACLKLDQPARALKYADKIKNWRRGSCYADMAFYCVKNGYSREMVQEFLDIAALVESTAASDWRRDTIKAKIARTHALMGNRSQADKFRRNLVDSQTGKVAGARADLSDDKDFDEHVKSTENLIKTGNYDVTSNALDSLAELYNRHYKDERRRAMLEEKITTYWRRLPGFALVRFQMRLARYANDHNDNAKALEFVNEAQQILDESDWPMRLKLPRMAWLAEIRFLSGDEEKARADADAALALFEENVEKIVNVARAEVLRPIAEAYKTMENTQASLAAYKKAVERGVDNPNSKPRAKDLSATCCSIALHEVKPDAELWEKIRQVRDGLGKPW